MKETHSYCACFRLFSCDPGPPTETFAELICFLGKPSLLVRDGGIPGLLMAKLPAGFLAATQVPQQRLFAELSCFLGLQLGPQVLEHSQSGEPPFEFSFNPRVSGLAFAGKEARP